MFDSTALESQFFYHLRLVATLAGKYTVPYAYRIVPLYIETCVSPRAPRTPRTHCDRTPTVILTYFPYRTRVPYCSFIHFDMRFTL